MQMNKQNKALLLLVVALTVALAIACGGGQSSIASTSISGTGNGGGTALTKVSGSIDQFGSVYVGGIEFDTDKAVITIDGSPGILDELELGMWVTVDGNLSTDKLTGSATKLIFETHLAGTVEEAPPNSGDRLKLGGLNVEIDGRTQFSQTLQRPISQNQDLKISGQYLSSGNFWASHIGMNNGAAIKLSPERLRALPPEDVYSTLWVELGEPKPNSTWSYGELELDLSTAAELSGLKRDQQKHDRLMVRGQRQGNTFVVDKYIDWNEDKEDDKTPEQVKGKVAAISLKERSIRVDGSTYKVRRFTRFVEASDSKQKNFGLKQLLENDWVSISHNKQGELLRLTRLNAED
jgi:hypothetical protein